MVALNEMTKEGLVRELRIAKSQHRTERETQIKRELVKRRQKPAAAAVAAGDTGNRRWWHDD